MRLYKRTLQTIIGDDDGSAISIDNLFTKIEIKKTLSSTPNEGTDSIYNLSDTKETLIREKGTRIRILGGYNGQVGSLFDGDIRKVERDTDGQNRITTITLGGNVFALTDAFANVSYQGAVSVTQIITDTIPSFGLSYANLDIIPASNRQDFSFTGRTADLFDQILEPIGVEWYEDSGFVQFSLVGQATETFPILNKDSGLIGSASITDDGVKAVSLMNANIRIGGRIKIESILVNGIYKVTQLMYRGDNREGDFFTEFLGVDSA